MIVWDGDKSSQPFGKLGEVSADLGVFYPHGSSHDADQPMRKDGGEF